MDDIVEGVVRVMQGAPERKNGEDGLPVPPYAVYNIGNQNPEICWTLYRFCQEKRSRGVLQKIMAKHTRNWFRCSRAMYL
ncbi:hypothetical protein [Hominenteromicrobium sp.]|uniref:hypothetical protein n=1 Tax=Hominenteromicrobium sp. TaxID=3073581 RepID=UPI00399BB6C9